MGQVAGGVIAFVIYVFVSGPFCRLQEVQSALSGLKTMQLSGNDSDYNTSDDDSPTESKVSKHQTFTYDSCTIVDRESNSGSSANTSSKELKKHLLNTPTTQLLSKYDSDDSDVTPILTTKELIAGWLKHDPSLTPTLPRNTQRDLVHTPNAKLMKLDSDDSDTMPTLTTRDVKAARLKHDRRKHKKQPQKLF